ncbi:MAG TPA: sensor histidine kinase [Geminicoccus sp.]|uniref:sensor histidine kinase n=1 Tax=Geminicoccus sp. TaxID=2024832 RepID=UPI002C50AF38|nr:sensor histidine kinase [Geminicoccus sp.]HWL69106.1 sensor histidine kinase [Geminicoccus sp.]
MSDRRRGSGTWSLVDALPARLRGLKARLAVIVALVLLVPTAFAIVQAMRVLNEDSQRQRATLERTLTLFVGYHDQMALQAARLLLSLAERPAVVEADPVVCSDALAAEANQNAMLLVLARADAEGRVICSSRPNAVGVSYAERPWFRQLASGQANLVSSGVIIGRTPMVGRTMVVAATIGGQRRPFDGTISAGLALEALIALPRSIQLPADAVALVVDTDGAIATTRGEVEPFGLDPEAIRGLLAKPGVPLIRADNEGRTWQFLARRSDVPSMRTAVLVGLPVQRWSWLDARFQSGILLPTSILFLSVFVVWVATDMLITRPLLRLAKAVRRWRREGEMPPLMLDGAPEELEELAHAFTRAATEIRERDALLHASLQEKDLLLREIHHRVKNNLQIVTSLLNLRAGSLRNAQAQRAMREAQLGIKALALVHRKLYERVDLKQVALDELLEELCSLVHDLSGELSPQVSLAVSLDPVVVVADQATPLALLCSELLTNAAKHAFPDNRPGTIEVRLERLEDGRARLTIADDGVGLEGTPPAAPDAATGLGTRLVQMFARQIGGDLSVESGAGGTRTTLVFTPLKA